MWTHELVAFEWKNECALAARPLKSQDKPRKTQIISDRPIDVAGEGWHASKTMLVKHCASRSSNRALRSFG